MPDYRVYVVDHDGEFFTSHALTCANDAEAIQTSQKLIERQGIELWQRDRKIAVFSSPDNALKEQRP
jgi:hypothetical protein